MKQKNFSHLNTDQRFNRWSSLWNQKRSPEVTVDNLEVFSEAEEGEKTVLLTQGESHSHVICPRKIPIPKTFAPMNG